MPCAMFSKLIKWLIRYRSINRFLVSRILFQLLGESVVGWFGPSVIQPFGQRKNASLAISGVYLNFVYKLLHVLFGYSFCCVVIYCLLISSLCVLVFLMCLSPGFRFLVSDSLFWIPGSQGFLALDSWLCMPGFGFLALDSRIRMPGFRLLVWDSWCWSPGFGILRFKMLRLGEGRNQRPGDGGTFAGDLFPF